MYTDAIRNLDTGEKTLVEKQISIWSSGNCDRWQRIVTNIQNETALPVDAFLDLLRDFCRRLIGRTTTPEAAWIESCRLHQFKGQILPPPIPGSLGRATPLSSYAAVISDSAGVGLTADQCESLIRKVHMTGSSPNPRETRTLQRARLGRYVIWATFSDSFPDESPFEHLPRTTEAIRTALGLGECSETETLVLLSYRTQGSWGSLELNRPSVAEAEAYCWYSPVSDMSSRSGMTKPLEPNSLGLSSQPEVVHREITGESLVFPLYLAV